MAKLAELVVEEMKTVLQTGMPAKLAAIQTEMADGITLAPIAEFIIGERPALDYPACWILVMESERELEETFQQHQFALGFWRHNLMIAMAICDPDEPERLRRLLYRYTRAIHEVIADNESYIENVSDWVRARITSVAFTGVFQHAEATLFRQDAYVHVEVSRYD